MGEQIIGVYVRSRGGSLRLHDGLLSFWFTRGTILSVMREKPLLFIKTSLWDKVGKKSESSLLTIQETSMWL
jgi:hypothetical protein